MVPAYLLSLLKQQKSVLKDRFAEKFPHHWLVWEPGAWTVPAATKETVKIDPRNLAASLGAGDALSFGLKLAPGKQEALRLGRNPTNDIVINDATVSRQHALLRREGDQSWVLEPAENVRALTRIGDVDLKPGQSAPLRSGARVKLGDVTLTYYDLDGLMQRLHT